MKRPQYTEKSTIWNVHKTSKVKIIILYKNVLQQR